MNSMKIALAAAAALFTIGTAAVAQTATAPATKAPATTTAPTMTAPAAKKGAKQAQTEASKACSAQADTQGLKGKPRKAFRKKCLNEAKAAAKKAS